jgi:hypothetical protein
MLQDGGNGMVPAEECVSGQSFGGRLGSLGKSFCGCDCGLGLIQSANAFVRLGSFGFQGPRRSGIPIPDADGSSRLIIEGYPFWDSR